MTNFDWADSEEQPDEEHQKVCERAVQFVADILLVSLDDIAEVEVEEVSLECMTIVLTLEDGTVHSAVLNLKIF